MSADRTVSNVSNVKVSFKDPFQDSFLHAMHYRHTQDMFKLVNSISTKQFRKVHTYLRDAKQPVSNHTVIPEYGITIGDLFFYTFLDKIKTSAQPAQPESNSIASCTAHETGQSSSFVPNKPLRKPRKTKKQKL